ncbi:hypothetical protein DRO66_10620 [Candidatus Bathyarchaeota archaeon]|nr:MAG: hypothetical protein DRO66_10620 [Candidatus Bathyarchaeota archaeon]
MLNNLKEPICKVKWLPRPDFYDQDTTSKNKMVTIGQIGGEDCLFFVTKTIVAIFPRINDACSVI